MVGCIKIFQRMNHQFLANKTKATSIGRFSIGELHQMTSSCWLPICTSGHMEITQVTCNSTADVRVLLFLSKEQQGIFLVWYDLGLVVL